MAPFWGSESPESRARSIVNLLRVALVVNLGLTLIILWLLVAESYKQQALNKAMADSQLVVQTKVDAVALLVKDVKDSVHGDLESFTKQAKERLESNSANSITSMMASYGAQSDSEQTLKAILDMRKQLDEYEDKSDAARKDLVTQMQVVRQQSSVATEAAKASHAKLNQKIITGTEAEQLKEAAKRKTTVISIWPWAQPKPTPRHRP
jgi:hypothetical protein